MQRGCKATGRPLGQPQRGVPYLARGGVGEAGDACGCKPLAGAQMQTLPGDTDLCEGV